MGIKLMNIDCLEGMKLMEENSVDAIVTDPPYGTSFMSKHWDHEIPSVEIWKECLRVLKPGGHLLAFSGTRTYHRMAVAIEDAGFEVRDMIEWVYGSGFSKCTVWKEGAKRSSENLNKENDLMVENGWDGWGRGGLKPAHEPICMARKPLAEKTVAENCLKWGTGGININESRVGTDKIMIRGGGNITKDGEKTFFPSNEINEERTGRFPANVIHDNSEEVRECFPDSKAGSYKGEGSKSGGIWSESTGKPAGMEYGGSGNASRFFKSIIYTAKASKAERNMGCEGLGEKNIPYQDYRENVDSTKSFVSHYPDGEPRPMNKPKNNHPTVKPLALMEYLVKLVTPKNGTVLDPFAGTATTLIACDRLGFNAIGFEKEKEYYTIGLARMKNRKPEGVEYNLFSGSHSGARDNAQL